MYVERTIEAFISKSDKQFPVLLVTGARQVGKTTLLQHLSNENRVYVTLDDPHLPGPFLSPLSKITRGIHISY